MNEIQDLQIIRIGVAQIGVNKKAISCMRPLKIGLGFEPLQYKRKSDVGLTR
jgi:hypothetical protein